MQLVVIDACKTSSQRARNVHSRQVANLVHGELFGSLQGLLNVANAVGEIEGVVTVDRSY